MSAEEVDRNWERLKSVEKGRSSVLDGIPHALPALSLADKVVGRAARVGVAPATGDRPGDGLGDGPDGSREEQVGQRLLALVVEARGHGVDAEQALRDAVRRLAADVRAAEADPTRG
jgi:XTP/dITP diphosphohydrolase